MDTASPTLNVRCDSITIGPLHKQILKDQRHEYESMLERTLTRLHSDISELEEQAPDEKESQKQKLEAFKVKKTGEYERVRSACQSRLDNLYDRFQKEWMQNPTETLESNSYDSRLPSASESQYLAHSVGDALQRALSEIAIRQPWDPIEYLALWLKKYAKNAQHAQQQAVDDLRLQLVREEVERERDNKKTLKIEENHDSQENERRKEMYYRRQNEIKEIQESSKQLSSSQDEEAKPKEEESASQDPDTSPDITEPPSHRMSLEGSGSEHNSLYTIDERETEQGSA